jgi:hypothetical protein
MFQKIFIFSLGFLLFFSFINVSFGATVSPTFTVTESAIIDELPLGGYRLKVNGTLQLENPSVISNIFEFKTNLNLGPLVGITPIMLDSTSENFQFTQNTISYYLIKPQETVKIGYFIYGIIDEDIYSKIENNGSTFLEYYSDGLLLYSNVIVNLQKPQREGYIYEDTGENIKVNKDTTAPVGNTSRLVSSDIRNPTDFDYAFSKISLYGSQSSNPMFDTGDLINTFDNITVSGYSYETIDFFHNNSNDYSVYWISYDMNIANIFNRDLERINTDVDSESYEADSTNADSTNFEPFVLKKSVDKTVVRSGEEFKVTLKIVNLNDFEVFNLSLEEEMPKGYVVKDVSTDVRIGSGSNYIFTIDSIDEYGTYVISYTLVNSDDLKGITYLKPATLTYKSESYYSEGILVINDILPDKKVFVQKEVEYVDETYARVTIKVRNLGSILLENILVSDIIDENAIIKEISKIFEERGVWRIKSLKPGEEWEVTYVVERNSQLDFLPNIFGVEKSNVYGTLISSEEVITIFGEQPRTIEKVGMGLAVGLLIFYLLF